MSYADKVLAFAGCLKNPDGSPFRLLPFQEDIIKETYTPNPDGSKVKRVLMTCGRQNGKSILSSLIITASLFMAAPGNDIASCATSRQQAGILYKYIKQLIQATPELAKITKFTDSKKRIENRRTGNSYTALSSDGASAHGFSYQMVVIDEYALITGLKGEELLAAVKSSMSARKDTLVFMISTAGSLASGEAWRTYEHALKVQQGLISDPSFRAFLYTNPADVALDDRDAWYRANPGLGLSKQLDYMEDAMARAIADPVEAHRFRRLELNTWGLGTETPWLFPDDWAACQQVVDWSQFKMAYCSVDLSTNTDLTSVVFIFPKDGKFYVKPHFWMPMDNIDARSRNDGVPYQEWMRQGFITGVDGDCIDYEQIQDWILTQATKYEIKEVAYDRYGAAQMSTHLSNQGGLVCVPVYQSYSGVSEACKFVQRLILSGKLVHDGHPVMKHHVDCVRVKQDATDRIMLKKPDRAKTVARIDGVAAMVTGFARAMFEGTSPVLWDGTIAVL